ncbi:hypothetical protein TIFTF001_016458 [Ficus carica]|uniref:Uncharacterized protein n=1 Tax=Ficus carica TaxID=3494 RepID=A0AA88D7F7_FICCA|nr:hypothetical protein TIFTF001_016458 [Ficus carica]
MTSAAAAAAAAVASDDDQWFGDISRNGVRGIVKEFDKFSRHRFSAYVLLTKRHQILLIESILVEGYVSYITWLFHL